MPTVAAGQREKLAKELLKLHNLKYQLSKSGSYKRFNDVVKQIKRLERDLYEYDRNHTSI